MQRREAWIRDRLAHWRCSSTMPGSMPAATSTAAIPTDRSGGLSRRSGASRAGQLPRPVKPARGHGGLPCWLVTRCQDVCPFRPLHLHSEYSLVDLTIRILNSSRPARAGLPAVAITDQNNLFAPVKSLQGSGEGRDRKPIAGADVLVADGTAAPSRLTLLCRDNDGYLSLAAADPRVDARPSRRWRGSRARPGWRRTGPVRDRRPAFGTGPAVRLGPPRPPSRRWADPGEVRRTPASELLRTGRAGEDAFNAFALDVRAPRHSARRQQRRALPRRRRLRRARGACASPAAACWTTRCRLRDYSAAIPGSRRTR